MHSTGDMDCALVFFCDFYFQLFNFILVKLNFMLETSKRLLALLTCLCAILNIILVLGFVSLKSWGK